MKVAAPLGVAKFAERRVMRSQAQGYLKVFLNPALDMQNEMSCPMVNHEVKMQLH
jgi:hypothetical protein